MTKIGIIGGSGLYQIEGIKIIEEREVVTPFGAPSDKLKIGTLDGVEVVFLPRHGACHTIPPHQINYRANIFAMKSVGVERLVSVSACGSLKKEIAPLDFLLPDQFVDRTNAARRMTFFEDGIVAHVSFADPVCSHLVETIASSAQGLGIKVHKGGTYINMEGPAFSTRAESNLYRSWGMDIIGMTNIAEARLAREAEMCYATIAAITDYDCWYESEETVTVEMVLANLTKNADNAKRLVRDVVSRISAQRTCSCQESLKYAIVTPPEAVPAALRQRLRPLIGRYMA